MMCLSEIHRGEIKKKALAKLPDSGYYWKTVTIYDGLCYPLFQRTGKSFDTGNNKTKTKLDGSGYNLGFHLYRNRIDAEDVRHWGWNRRVIRCVVKKKDIVAIGLNRFVDHGKTIVTSRFWMPKPS